MPRDTKSEARVDKWQVGPDEAHVTWTHGVVLVMIMQIPSRDALRSRNLRFRQVQKTSMSPALWNKALQQVHHLIPVPS